MTKKQPVFPALIADIKDRETVGIKTYGDTLKTFHIRGAKGPSLNDVYEEVLDMAVYLKRELLEREEMVKLLGGVFRELEQGEEVPEDLYTIRAWLRGDDDGD